MFDASSCFEPHDQVTQFHHSVARALSFIDTLGGTTLAAIAFSRYINVKKSTRHGGGKNCEDA